MRLPHCLLLTNVLTASIPYLAQAAITIHFDSPTYQVQPLGTVQTTISYDADPNTPGDIAP